jgi:hypothetical protein
VTTDVWLMPGGTSARPRRTGPVAVMYGNVRPHRLALLTGAVLSLLTTATGLAPSAGRPRLIGDLGNHRAVAGAGRTHAEPPLRTELGARPGELMMGAELGVLSGIG